MNNEEIVKIFVESVILRIPYEEMKRRKLAEKMQVEPKNPEIKNEKNKSNAKSPINSNKSNKSNNPNIKSNKSKKTENQKSTPIKKLSIKTNNKNNKNEYTPYNNTNIINTKTTKSTDKKKKIIKTKKELTDRKQEFNRRIKFNLFSEEKPRRIKKDKKIKIYENSLKLTKDLIKKQQEEIDFNRKFDYLKKRIEALKVKEEKIRLEKNYNQKKEVKIGGGLATKIKQKKMLEEFKKRENDKMKNRKETAKKIYENENKTLKNYGSELSLKNRGYFLQMKKEKEKLNKEKMQKEEELMKQRKNKMQLNKSNKNNINKEHTPIPNLETQNNQKMNYLYAAKSIEYLKQNIINLEKLEKEYIKKIQDEKKGIPEIPQRKNLSARKSKNRYKLSINNKEEKNTLDNNLQTQEKDYSIEAKDDAIVNDIDIDNIKLETKLSNKYQDDSLKSYNSKENIKEAQQIKENIPESEKKESNPELITLDKIILENK